MRPIEESLTLWKESLSKSIDVAGLYARNPDAHKWKAPFRSMSLRESVSWRTNDLLIQSLNLYDSGHILGARILLRSAFETLSILIHLNQITRSVLSGNLNFHKFSDKTSALLLGSRDGSTPHDAINIMTIISRCNKRYPGIESLYAGLSESAHPNYEGVSIGYSNVDQEDHIVTFENKWKKMYQEQHVEAMRICVHTFYHEYNEEWMDAFDRLEVWIAENDEALEATKGGV